MLRQFIRQQTRHCTNTHTEQIDLGLPLSSAMSHRATFVQCHTHTQLTDRAWASSLHCNVTLCDICTMSHSHTSCDICTLSHSATFLQCHTYTANRSILGFLSPLQRHTMRHLCNVTHTANRSILGFLSPLQYHTMRHLHNVTHTQLTDRAWASSLHCNVTCVSSGGLTCVEQPTSRRQRCTVPSDLPTAFKDVFVSLFIWLTLIASL